MRVNKNIENVCDKNDIKYRGILSYRALRIIAWVCIFLGQMTVIFKIGSSLKNPDFMAAYSATQIPFEIISNLSLPFFLLASFSIILRDRNAIKRLIIQYLCFTFVMYVLFVYFYFHIGYETFVHLYKDPAQAQQMLDEFISLTFDKYVSINVFIDLLMCTLACFFINYNPKEHFKGKNIIYFRLLVILPIAYEIVCFVLRILSGNPGLGLKIPNVVRPLLTTKPPLTFAAFLALSIFVKHREKIFLKKGKTEEEYEAFLKTNANSLHFSIFCAITFAIVATIDLIVLFIVGLPLTELRSATNTMNIGRTAYLFLLIPFVFLFSYTRTHKSKLFDTLLPLIAIGCIIFLYIEGIHILIMKS